jgi:hypothetical protein
VLKWVEVVLLVRVAIQALTTLFLGVLVLVLEILVTFIFRSTSLVVAYLTPIASTVRRIKTHLYVKTSYLCLNAN